MNRALTNEEFLNKLKQNNKYYRDNLFKVNSEYIKQQIPIIVEDAFGVCSMYSNSLLKGRIPSIKTAIDKKEYFLNRLKEKNPIIYSQVIDIPFFNKLEDKVDVLTTLGIITITLENLEKLKRIDSRSIKNQTDFYLYKIKKNRNDFNNIDYSKFEVESTRDNCVFICKIHNLEYRQKLYHHLNNHQGCYKCDNSIVYNNKNILKMEKEQGIFYVVRLSNHEENFFKIGITAKSVLERLKELSTSYSINIEYIEKNNLSYCYKQEQKFLQDFKKYKYAPKIKFGGHTECLTTNPIAEYYNWYNN